MGMADVILAGEGDLYDINEYHMLAHIIIFFFIRLMILAQSVHEDVVLYIYLFCVFHISKLTITYSYSMNAPLSLVCFCHVC